MITATEEKLTRDLRIEQVKKLAVLAVKYSNCNCRNCQQRRATLEEVIIALGMFDEVKNQLLQWEAESVGQQLQ